MVDDIGGIDVHNPRPFSDEYLKPNGLQGRPDPPQRVRRDGVLADPQEPARRRLRPLGQPAARRCAASRPRSGPRPTQPGFIERGVLTVMAHTAHQPAAGELFELAQAVAQVDPSKITTCVVQGGIGNVGGASVVFPSVARPAATATTPARTRRSGAADPTGTVCRARWCLDLDGSHGAPGRIRTCDSWYRKPVLYPLSYGGKRRDVRARRGCASPYNRPARGPQSGGSSGSGYRCGVADRPPIG